MDKELFCGIAKMSQVELFKCMAKFLIGKYNKSNVEIHEGNIYAIGTIPITLIAHLDTIFPTPPKNIYYDEEKSVMWSPEGLGADDRAGVYAIIKIIQSGLRPSVLLCADEEAGCLGATEFVSKYHFPLTKTNYLIEIDRRGSNDCVFYDTENPEFVSYIESFGFKTAAGTYSDVLEIGTAWKIPGVNLSSGYYNEHSMTEILNTKELDYTIERVKKMLTAEKIPTFDYIPKMSLNRCALCGEKMTMYEDYLVRTFNKKSPYLHVCPTCLGTNEKINWCTLCHSPYVGEEECCPKCMEEINKK